MYNRILFYLLLFLLPVGVLSQTCSLSLRGYVKDQGTEEPLDLVTVRISETQNGSITDSTGFFSLSGLCPGPYHLIISHIGCEPQTIFIELNKDSTLRLTLEHTENTLDDVVIIGELSHNTTQQIERINAQDILDQANENLANMLASIPGVSSLKNGNGISKPIIHGLYGNRLAIINNGVSQSGQQWGNDHSPEIDPLAANSIQVIKGTAALMYMGANMGGVILIEPEKIQQEPHVHGKANYFFETNGLTHGLNLQLQQYNPKLAWKVNGTWKKSGDKKSASYFLNNTGYEEANLALQLEKSFSDKFKADVYISTFNTELGVLRGSHVGNLTDLAEAFQRSTPLFTEDTFSYRIEAPKQLVNHHLAKVHVSYLIDNSQGLDFTLAGQLNQRKEFDVRRSGRSEVPALSLTQFTYFAEAKHQKVFSPLWKVKSGIQFNFTDNRNNPETGILPLIPDYFMYETGLYATAYRKGEKSLFEAGIRYGNISQKVVAISNTTPRSLLRYNNTFHNLSAAAGWTWRVHQDVSLAYNLGYTTRNPAINELYSNGLHQGVSGIEEGNPNLEGEQSLKTTLGLKGNIADKFSFETLLYAQQIDDYIFLNPQDEIRLTIRGAFPVFSYEQTDARLWGFDMSGKYELTHSWHAQVMYSFIRGRDLIQALSIINLPSNNISGMLSYEFPKALHIGNKAFENVMIAWDHQYVFRQNGLTAKQDFVLPPDAYYLMGLKLSANIPLPKTRLRVTVKADNLLNERYRDYLNRQRYFADDLGRNVMLGASLIF